MGGAPRTRDVRGSGFVAVTIALAACGTTLAESEDVEPTKTNGGDASDVTDSSNATSLDAGGDNQVSLGDGDVDAGPDASCNRAIDEAFVQLPPWSLTTQNGGSVTHAVNGGLGGSGALRAEVVGSGSSTAAQLSREIVGALPKSLRLSFAMRVPSASGYAELGCTLQVRAADAQTFISFQPEVSSDSVSFDSVKKLNGSNMATGNAETIGALDANHWYAVDVRLDDVTTAGGRVTASFDAVKRYDRAFTFPAAPEAIRVKCGVDYGAGTAAAVVLVDDVVLELCP